MGKRKTSRGKILLDGGEQPEGRKKVAVQQKRVHLRIGVSPWMTQEQQLQFAVLERFEIDACASIELVLLAKNELHPVDYVHALIMEHAFANLNAIQKVLS